MDVNAVAMIMCSSSTMGEAELFRGPQQQCSTNCLECSQLDCICHMLPTIVPSAAPMDLPPNLDMATYSVLFHGFLQFSKLRDSNSIVLFPSIQRTQGSRS